MTIPIKNYIMPLFRLYDEMPKVTKCPCMTKCPWTKCLNDILPKYDKMPKRIKCPKDIMPKDTKCLKEQNALSGQNAQWDKMSKKN